MLWLPVMTLDDGSRVETSMPTHDRRAADPPSRASYRLIATDGTALEFSTLSAILNHLETSYPSDELHRATRRDVP